jgi:hypothetical protein
MVESRDERTRDALMEKIVRGFAPLAGLMQLKT